jgi:hypothetical protein
MTDDAESGRSHGNEDGLNTVTDAVHAATAEVSEVGRHSAMRVLIVKSDRRRLKL